MLKRLKTLPLTIVLTVLIWMYAEAQFTSTRDNVRLSVKLVAGPDLSVRVFDAQGVARSLADLTVNLEGPKNLVDAIGQQSLDATPDDDFSTLTYSVPAWMLPKNGGDNTVDTVSILNTLSYFKKRNVRVTSAIPARLKLETDTLVKLNKAVEFEPAVAVAHFAVKPEEVTVSVPSRTLQDIGGAEKIRVLAIPQRDLASLPPDSDQTVPVRLKAEYPGLPDDRVTVGPVQGGTVELRLARRAGVLQVVPDVPVWVAGPPSVLEKFDVELRTKVVKVVVSGSAASIAALKQKMAAPAVDGAPAHGIRVYLDLSPEDKPGEGGGFAMRKLRYVLPEGLTLQESPAEGEFRLVERVLVTPGK